MKRLLALLAVSSLLSACVAYDSPGYYGDDHGRRHADRDRHDRDFQRDQRDRDRDQGRDRYDRRDWR